MVGLDDSGKYLVQVYWVMGRSANSRNRVLSADGGRVYTEFADPYQGGDPNLVIYNAMNEIKGFYVVGNGSQTDQVLRYLRVGMWSFADLMLGKPWKYEPDAPNFTPRITAACSLLSRPIAQMCILKKAPLGNSCQRQLFSLGRLSAGFGYCITTYLGDGDPLPSFRGEPYLVPLPGGIEKVAEFFWSILNAEHRVSLAVKFIAVTWGKSQVHIINKYKKKA